MEREDIINELEQYGVYNPISCASDNIASLIDYIAELTEQNESLGKDLMSANDSISNKRAKIKELAEKNKKLSAQNYMLCPDGTIAMIPTVKSVRTDTVQEVIASIDEMFRRQRYESMWIDKNGAVLGRVDIGDAQECWDGYIKPELERMLEDIE